MLLGKPLDMRLDHLGRVARTNNSTCKGVTVVQKSSRESELMVSCHKGKPEIPHWDKMSLTVRCCGWTHPYLEKGRRIVGEMDLYRL